MKKILLLCMVVSLVVTGCATTTKSEVGSTVPENTEITTEEVVETVDGKEYLSVITEEDLVKLYPDETIRAYAKKYLGKKMPNLEIRNIDGTVSDMASKAGKPYIIEFMGTWCPVCTEIYPELELLVKNNPEISLTSVVIDESEETIRDYLKKNEFTKEIFFSNVDSGTFYKMFELEFVPAFFFVDENGVIVRLHIGGGDAEILKNMYETAF